MAASGKPTSKSLKRCETTKPEEPGQRDLHQRHLADEAGDDHVGQADGHRRQRDDQRVAVVVGQHDQGHRADDRRERGGRAEALGPRDGRQALLDELAARRQARAAHVERDDDEDEGQQRADPGQRGALVGREPALRRGVVEQRLHDADREPDEGGDPERREAREEHRAQCGHDLQRQRGRVELGQRRGEDAHPARDDRAQHGVGERQLTRGQAGEDGRHLVLAAGARGQAEARVAIGHGQQDGDDDHDPRQPEAVGRDRDAGDLDGVARQHRRGRQGARPVDQRRGRLQGEQDAERGDQPRQRRRGPQRPEAEQLDRGAEHDGEGQRAHERDRRVDHGLQRVEGVAGRHRHRAGRHVDDARAAIGQDDAQPDPGDEGAGPQPEQREQDDLIHGGSDHPDAARAVRQGHSGGRTKPDAFLNWPLPL